MRRRLLPALIASLAAVVSAAAFTAGSGAEARADDAATSPSDSLDALIFRNGRRVEGRIISETDTEIVFEVVVSGIKAKTTYPKAEILEIQRNAIEAPVATEIPATPMTTEPSKPASAREGVPKVYLLELEGDLGWDISETPLKNVFADAVSHKPDVIVVSMDCGSRPRRFDGLFQAEDLGPIVEKLIADGNRVVFWIDTAAFGAAFLPLVSPEIYFYTEGRLGGVGDLSDFDIGDEMVNQKQISLRLGHAEGFAIKGGYEPLLVRAMALREMWLCAKIVGGKPIYIQREPRPQDGEGWIVLTDDGEGSNKDEFQFEGNDVLNLDAEMARKLGVSKGTVDNLDDLIFELRIGRDYEVEHGKSEQILERWKDDVERAVDQIERLQQELQEVASGSRDGTLQRKRLLEQWYGILTRFAEVLDPEGEQRAQIDVELEKIRQMLRVSNERPSSPRGRGPGLR